MSVRSKPERQTMLDWSPNPYEGCQVSRASVVGGWLVHKDC
jgi:hypothetical protein